MAPPAPCDEHMEFCRPDELGSSCNSSLWLSPKLDREQPVRTPAVGATQHSGSRKSPQASHHSSPTTVELCMWILRRASYSAGRTSTNTMPRKRRPNASDTSTPSAARPKPALVGTSSSPATTPTPKGMTSRAGAMSHWRRASWVGIASPRTTYVRVIAPAPNESRRNAAASPSASPTTASVGN